MTNLMHKRIETVEQVRRLPLLLMSLFLFTNCPSGEDAVEEEAARNAG